MECRNWSISGSVATALGRVRTRPLSLFLHMLNALAAQGWLYRKWVRVSVAHGSDVHVFMGKGVCAHDVCHAIDNNYVETYMRPLYKERHSVWLAAEIMTWLIIAICLCAIAVNLVHLKWLDKRHRRMNSGLISLELLLLGLLLWVVWRTDALKRSTYHDYMQTIPGAEINSLLSHGMNGLTAFVAFAYLLFAISFIYVMLGGGLTDTIDGEKQGEVHLLGDAPKAVPGMGAGDFESLNPAAPSGQMVAVAHPETLAPEGPGAAISVPE